MVLSHLRSERSKPISVQQNKKELTALERFFLALSVGYSLAAESCYQSLDVNQTNNEPYRQESSL